MKRISKLLILLIAVLLLAGCKSNKGYGLVEITGNDLLKNLTEEKSFAFAIINPDNKKTEDFKNDLNRIAKEKKIDIYYIDSTMLSFNNSEQIKYLYNIDLNNDYYFYNGKDSFHKLYSDYKTVRDNYKDIKVDTNIKIQNEKELKENLNKAKESYKEGKIGEALNYVYEAWPLDEAKEFYKKSDYFNIVNEWESKSEIKGKLAIKKLAIFQVTDYIFTYEYNGKTEDYKEPLAKEYKDEHYRIKDGIIYTSKDSNDFQERFKIISISKEDIILEENGKQTRYVRFKKEN